jgi:hypothetical protein
MPAPAATWLDPDDVRAWLKLAAGTDSDLIDAVVARSEVEVQRARPDQWVVVITADDEIRTYTPDAEVYNAAVMLAGRVYRRRNSPGGVELFADSVAYVSRYDPEIQRALRQGAWAWPAVG